MGCEILINPDPKVAQVKRHKKKPKCVWALSELAKTTYFTRFEGDFSNVANFLSIIKLGFQRP